MIYVLSFWSDVAFSIKQALRTFSCTVAAVIYNFIVDLYNVFMYTARAEILESSFIQGIYNKVGMILGIFMVFKLSFSLIQSLVDPSKFTDEKKGIWRNYKEKCNFNSTLGYYSIHFQYGI